MRKRITKTLVYTTRDTTSSLKELLPEEGQEEMKEDTGDIA